MSSQISSIKNLLPTLAAALNSFTNSTQAFRVVHTLPALTQSATSPRTLYILDSSYNPPTRAHLSLAASALCQTSLPYPGPHRLLLLFSTHNADKAPSPAAFEQRLAMMVILATDLQEKHQEAKNIAIDIGLTTAPYYTDKSTAIAEAGEYGSDTKHIHLLGYDTLIRFLAPKYYPKFNPPLSALAPFFGAGHGLLCTQRSDLVPSADSSASGNPEEIQTQYLEGLKRGDLDNEGFQREWANQIALVHAQTEAEGVSSTTVRKAASAGDWDKVGAICSPSISEWIKEGRIYSSL